MKKASIPSLDEGRYAETFAVFVERSLEYPLMVEELVRVVEEHLPAGFRMLDIGAGTGQVVQSLMAASASSAIGHYCAYEPNPRHVAQLRTAVAAIGLPHAIEARPFSEDTAVLESFDFVLFSHSLYWMPDPARCMLHAARSLNAGGVALALIQGPYGVHAMFPLFEPQLDRTTPILQNNAVSSHELVIGLRALGAKPEVSILPTAIDMTGLFDRGAEDELAELISFCMQIEFSRLPDPLRSDVVRYVHGGCVIGDGRLLWPLPNAAVLLRQDRLPPVG